MPELKFDERHGSGDTPAVDKRTIREIGVRSSAVNKRGSATASIGIAVSLVYRFVFTVWQWDTKDSFDALMILILGDYFQN